MRLPSPQRRAGGFTLVEMGITLMIVALVAAMVVPALNNVSRGDLRQAASGLCQTVRSAYDSAALEGVTYRLTLTPGKNVLKVESTSAAIAFDREGGAVASAAQDDAPAPGGIADLMPKLDAGSKAGGKSPLDALAGISALSEQSDAAGFDKVGSFAMPTHVTILDVWAEGLEESQKEAADVYLYFFPGGYTQDAIINLRDGDQRIYGVRLAPLTGRCRVEPGYMDVPK